ncbi:MAG: metal-sensitive transcriptional regulator [Elusimicrobiota bacterium]
MIDVKMQTELGKRLNKIAGQINGIRRMIENKKYCVDIINQITAVRRALESLGCEVMKNHINTCIKEDIKRTGGEDKINELMETIHKFIK